MPDGTVPDETVPDDDAVRALLGSLRDPDADVPPEVAARLEARLADLADGPAEHAGTAEPVHPEGTVVDMPAARGGGRTARGLLVAAAVAAVVGLGAVQVLDPLGGGSASVESAGGQPTGALAEEDAGGDGSQGRLDARSTEELAAEGATPQSADDDPAADTLPALSTRSFALDVAALPAEPEADPVRPPESCTPGRLLPRTDVRAVLLDGRPGVLALFPEGADGAAEGSRVTEAWQCGDLAGPAGNAAPPRVRMIVGAG